MGFSLKKAFCRLKEVITKELVVVLVNLEVLFKIKADILKDKAGVVFI